MLSEILETIKRNLFLISLIVLISLLSFQLGRISKTAGQPIKIEKASVQEVFSESANEESRGIEKVDFRVVVSRKSTSKKYHFLWCPGAKQIKEENKLFFDSESAAISAEYTLAGNCLK